MIEKYCVFLRGINAGGIKIKMDALKEAFYKMNFSDVKTILATGNVIATVPGGSYIREELKSLIEKGLSDYFSYDAHVILRNNKEIADIYSAAQAIPVSEECHQYILLCDDQALLFELKRLFDSMSCPSQEQLFLSEHGAFWIVPKGSTLDSDFGSKVLGDKKYKSRLTSRNINTIEKVHKLLLDEIS